LFMTVYPGKGGQSYLNFVEEKINQLVEIDKGRKILIGVDGGIKFDTISYPYNSGARMFVSGTGILNNELGYLGAVNQLRKSIWEQCLFYLKYGFLLLLIWLHILFRQL